MSTQISGNAPPSVKAFLAKMLDTKAEKPFLKGFGKQVAKLLRLAEVSVNKSVEEPSRIESKVVFNITVEDALLNANATVHGGCFAYLIDTCSTFALMAYTLTVSDEILPGVSQSLNVVYHSPASLGDELKIINTTMTVGARVVSARTEIWDITKKRLVASGVHIKMQPSQKL